MTRFAAVLFFLINPMAATALCEGRDLIAQMPQAERATLAERAEAMPYPEGLLWRASKGDTEIIWFGTYHFAHDETRSHLEALKPMIGAAQHVYLEVSNTDMAQMEREVAADPSIMFLTEGPTLPDLLGEADWQIYRQAMAERAIPGFMAAKFKPIWAAMMLGVGPCEARNGVLEGDGIDKLIGLHAEALGNPSRSLESYRALLTMLDSFPQEDQLDMIRLFLTEELDADDMAYTLRQRYLAQEMALLWEFSKAISLELGGPDAAEDFALFEKLLLEDRNRAWVALLLEAADGRQVFAAVGAAHLPGETGVLRLLEEEGFLIERLPFNP